MESKAGIHLDCTSSRDQGKSLRCAPKLSWDGKNFYPLANAKEFHLSNMRRNNAGINNDVTPSLSMIGVDDFLEPGFSVRCHYLLSCVI